MEADDASLQKTVSALIPQFKDLLSRIKQQGHTKLDPHTVQDMLACSRGINNVHWDVSSLDSDYGILHRGFLAPETSSPSSSNSGEEKQSNQLSDGVLWIFLTAQIPPAEIKPFSGEECGRSGQLGAFLGAKIKCLPGDESRSGVQIGTFSGVPIEPFSSNGSGSGAQIGASSGAEFKPLSNDLGRDEIQGGTFLVPQIKSLSGEHGNQKETFSDAQMKPLSNGIGNRNGPQLGHFLGAQTKLLSKEHGNGNGMQIEDSLGDQIKPFCNEVANEAQFSTSSVAQIKPLPNDGENVNGLEIGPFSDDQVKPLSDNLRNANGAQIESSLVAEIKPLSDDPRNANGAQIESSLVAEFKPLSENARNENGTIQGIFLGPQLWPITSDIIDRTIDDSVAPKTPDFVLGCIKALPPPSHPLTQLVSAIMALQSRSHATSSADVYEPDCLDLIPHLPLVGAFIYRRVGNDGHKLSSPDHLAAKFSRVLGFDDPKIYGVCLVGSTVADPPYIAFAAGMNGYAGPLHDLVNQESFKWLNKVSVDVGVPNASRDCLEEYVQQALEAGQMMPVCGRTHLKQEDSRSIHMDFKLGDDFATIDDLKEKLRAACLEKHVEFYVVKSSRSKYTVRCRNAGCGWRMHASILGTGPTCRIRALAEHTCEGAPGLGNKNASAQWIAQKLQEKIKQHPNYRPVDIIRDLQREEGIQIPYARAWRGKEAAMISIHGDELKGYCMLPGYLSAIRTTNPGSVGFMECRGVTFYRLFLAYSACLRGFKYCRPFVAFDATQLTGKFQGCLLSATGLDARDQLYPIALAVVDVENEENWMWFMTALRQSLQLETCILTLISNREKGLVEAGSAVFPESKHAFCMRHLVETLKKEYTSNGEFIKLIWSAAHQVSMEKFEEAINAARVLCPDGVQYMLDVDPVHWATAHFPGRRWGHLTSTVAESVNSWLQEARSMPIIAMLESIRKQLAEWFFQRRQEAETAVQVPQFDPSTLIQPIDEKIREAMASSQHYLVRPSDLTVFEIDTGKQTRIVNLDGWDCTCKEWQIYGVPCSHACAAILFRGDQCQMYADRCFSIEAYKESYESPIYPIDMQSIVMENVLPPETRRPPGRPRKRQITAAELEENTRPFTCSRCGMQQRHNRRTCKNPVRYIEGNYMTEGPAENELPPCENTTDALIDNSEIMAPQGGGVSDFSRGYGRGRGRGRGRGHSNIHPPALNA